MLEHNYFQTIALCCWPGDTYYRYKDYVIIVPKLLMSVPMTFDTFRKKEDHGKVLDIAETKAIYIDSRVMKIFSEDKIALMLDHMIFAREFFINKNQGDKLLKPEAILSLALDAAEDAVPLPPEWGSILKELLNRKPSDEIEK